MPIRHRVLWPDKPPEFCHIDGDAEAMHFGAFVNEILVCVASIYVDKNKARLRKFATDTSYQGQGVGSIMLNHIVQYLKKIQTEFFWCDARESALGIYQKLGMKKCSERFYKADVAYFKMELAL
ncbi:GNAT family N-acetyltransferase [Thalassotalea algicola]|nr:GNAT family N-acetyltransferase [Thalassotalea algicola]